MIDIEKSKRDVGFVAVALAFIFMLSLIVQLIALPLLLWIAPSLADSAVFAWVMGSLPLYLIAMPCSLVFFWRVPTTPPQKQPSSKRTFLAMLAVCLVSTYLLSYVGSFVNELFSSLLGIPATNDLEATTTAAPLWANLVFLVLLAPVFEEIFLRKLVIDRLLPYGELAAVLLSGVAFGLVHGNFNQLFYAVASGILFGLLYVKTGSLKLNIALHACLNFFGGVYGAEIQKLESQALQIGPLSSATLASILNAVYVAILVAAALVCAFLLLRFKRWRHLLRFSPPSPPLSTSDWRSILLANPFVYFFLAFSVLLFFI